MLVCQLAGEAGEVLEHARGSAGKDQGQATPVLRHRVVDAAVRPADVSPGDSPRAGLLEVRRALGNRRFGALARQLAASPALALSAPGDPLEREADAVADRVAADGDADAPAGRVPGGVAVATHAVREPPVPLGGGEPLAPAVRAFFEPRLGCDLGRVRVHTDRAADLTARSLGASAFTVGGRVAFRAGRYEPGTAAGRRLLAHELAHTARDVQGPGGPATVIHRQAPDLTRQSILPSVAAGMSDDELQQQIGLLRRILGQEPAGTPAHEGAAGNLAVLEDEVRRRSAPGTAPLTFQAGTGTPGAGTPAVTPLAPLPGLGAGAGAGGVIQVPTDVEYELVDGPGVDLVAQAGGQFGIGGAALRSTAIGGARGIGYLLSPPVRGLLDPFRPLSARLGPEFAQLGAQESGWFAAERYLTSPLRELRPRYATQAGELFLQQGLGRSEWLRLYNITEKQLGELPGLIARMAEGGIDSLAPAERQLVEAFFRAHAESGLKLASPALSATVRPGLSGASGVAPLFREAPYVVRIRVPANTVADVNAVLGTARPQHLVQELEVLVFTDARGAVTSIRPNPTSALGKAAPGLSWAGRGLIVVGVGVSAYRISTATSEELPRVVGEEAGGWGGGYAGASLGAGACILFGIATEGVGLLLCGLVGGAAGGVGGSYVGGEIGEDLGRLRNMTPAQYNEAALQLFGTPQQKREYYELMEFFTGPPVDPFSEF
jgi:hypothetical protein